MKRLQNIVGVPAFVLLIFVALAPLLQHYLPRGVLASREATSGWSDGLAQISFGLVAAFVVFFLPPVVDVGRFIAQWTQRGLYYRHTPTLDLSAAIDWFADAIQNYDIHTPGTLPNSVTRWIADRKKAPGVPLTDAQSDATINLFASDLNDVIVSDHHWKLLLEHSAALPGSRFSQTNELRQLLLATHCLASLKTRRRNLAVVLGFLIITSFYFGTLALAPDPFWYVGMTRYMTGRFPLPSDYRYPELALWLSACAYLADIFFLALWFWLESYNVHLHDPKNFPE